MSSVAGPETPQRKLAVILSADIVGYSSLMERDEEGTLSRLKRNRSTVFEPCVGAHGGRVFKLMGDGLLVEFASAVAAVNCALRITAETAAAENGVPDSERLRFRIGINLGDIIVEGDDIYGEGVNVAARLQTLAPAGGVALARNVFEQVGEIGRAHV
jgi:adenylate cyclase